MSFPAFLAFSDYIVLEYLPRCFRSLNFLEYLTRLLGWMLGVWKGVIINYSWSGGMGVGWVVVSAALCLLPAPILMYY